MKKAREEKLENAEKKVRVRVRSGLKGGAATKADAKSIIIEDISAKEWQE